MIYFSLRIIKAEIRRGSSSKFGNTIFCHFHIVFNNDFSIYRVPFLLVAEFLTPETGFQGTQNFNIFPMM